MKPSSKQRKIRSVGPEEFGDLIFERLKFREGDVVRIISVPDTCALLISKVEEIHANKK